MNIINQTEALDYLKSGKTIIFPTETSYGLGCDATNQKAVNKIFEIKKRFLEKWIKFLIYCKIQILPTFATSFAQGYGRLKKATNGQAIRNRKGIETAEKGGILNEAFGL